MFQVRGDLKWLFAASMKYVHAAAGLYIYVARQLYLPEKVPLDNLCFATNCRNCAVDYRFDYFDYPTYLVDSIV
jgi:hypothetical protein